MQTRVSTKGQVVLPRQVRHRLGIRPGDPMNIEIEGTSVILTMRPRRKAKARIVNDPATGLPVLALDSGDVPVLTSREVDQLLANFP